MLSNSVSLQVPAELYDYYTSFPNIDGHFWVVRNGIILDHNFEFYNLVEKMWKCDKRQLRYLPAPEMTQKIMIEIFLRPLKKRFGDLPLRDLFIEATNYSRHDHALQGMCFLNAIMEIAKGGGELVFGSLGLKFINKPGHHWEYGGEDYKTVADFMNKQN